MKLTQNLLLLSEIFPYFTRGSNIKNKISITMSILFGKNCQIKFNNGIHFSLQFIDLPLILNLLQVERFAQKFKKINDKIEISFDNENNFYISSNHLTQEDKRLITLLARGMIDGAVFLDKNHKLKIKNNKILKIIQNEQNLVITYEGIKFFLDSIGPEIIIETFVRRIHDSYSNDLENKIVIDAGASVGDTPLYFAYKKAIVYAFEMTKTNYDLMIKNLELNPNLSDKIIPVHAAVGKDGILEYSEDISQENFAGGASFVVNKYGKNSIKQTVMGMSIQTILKKFDISKIGLLKLDCKGCEYYLQKMNLILLKK